MTTPTIEDLASREYTAGFLTDIESEGVPPGLNEDTVRFISAKKGEPEWMLEWRLKAYRHWLTMEEPHEWPHLRYPKIDYQASSYFSAVFSVSLMVPTVGATFVPGRTAGLATPPMTTRMSALRPVLITRRPSYIGPSVTDAAAMT